ncbi:MAG TPA: hypothetical protein VGF76_15380 [Polyangiaceae bacterium]
MTWFTGSTWPDANGQEHWTREQTAVAESYVEKADALLLIRKVERVLLRLGQCSGDANAKPVAASAIVGGKAVGDGLH